MRDDHEKQKVFGVKKELRFLHNHALFGHPLKNEKREYESRLATRQGEEVAEELAQKIFATAYRLGKKERVDAGAKVSDHGVRHDQRRKKRQGHKGVGRE